MNEQMNIFQVMYPRFKISNKIRLIELFAGIGSQAMALRDLGVNFEHYRVVEFDKNAIASYNAIHRTDFSPMDITRVHANDLDIKDLDIFTYIMTYSFPCQDLSLAGNKKGMKKGSGTRSGLLWEVERILDEILAGEAGLPQVLLMENVPQILNSRNIEDFRSWQNKLESLGYKNYTQVLNAKDYGVPQNRKRCFMVSILGNYWFEFPRSTVLKIHLRDFLEDNVPEKYYLSESAIKTFTDSSDWGGYIRAKRFHPLKRELLDCAYAITTRSDRTESNFVIEVTKQ